MTVELVPALTAGAVGGFAMAVLAVAGTVVGRPPFDLSLMWASFLGLAGQRVVGLAVHLAVSATIAVLYAIGFRLTEASDAGWAWGLTASVIHWVIAGAFVGSVPALGGPEPSAPGPFAMRGGALTAVGFLVAHLVFGLIVGSWYFAFHPDGGIDAAL